jgi:NifU-like protein involved in Fe-S cluster formation
MSTKPGHSTRPAASRVWAAGRSRRPSPKRANGSNAKKSRTFPGLTHGVGWCAPQQGACKLTLNIKQGVIEEALVETIGCSGMTHSAAMAAKSWSARPFWKR